MEQYPLLSLSIFLPMIGALLIYFIARGSEKRQNKYSKIIALIFSLLNLALAFTILSLFNQDISDYQFIEYATWMPRYNIAYYLGIDGISVYFIVLTALLIPICILASWHSINHKVKEFMILIMVVESMIIGVFAALDFTLFYIFFEAILIPIFMMIGIWGSERKIYASYKFFLYTLLGSLLLLLAIIYLCTSFNTSNIIEITKLSQSLPFSIQSILWLMMFCSFAIKIPMVPFHTWLPDAHVQAPTAGSVILAGILLKMGGYGFIRFSLPMLPLASIYFAPFVIILSVAAIIYTSIIAIMQTNMKKMIAYSSIAHMGFVTIGIFTLDALGINGAIFQMISHGLISSALFLSIGILYDKMHTKEISKFSGVANIMPKLAIIFMIILIAAIGFPGSSGFVGEIMILFSMFKEYKILTILSATSMVLGAIYMLWLYKRVFFGVVLDKKIARLQDISWCEILYFSPLVILVIILGIYPSLITNITNNSINNLIFNIITR
jgi:NADH-quinone oxidoreductase subunit M